jgi:hypothetical protein
MLAILCAAALSCSLGGASPATVPTTTAALPIALPTTSNPLLITIPPATVLPTITAQSRVYVPPTVPPNMPPTVPPVANPSLPPVIGILSISPTTPNTSMPNGVFLQPGSTITLRLDGIQNVASVIFELPPPGWNGNGLSLSDPQPVLNGVSQYSTVIPFDHIGQTFVFSAEARGFNGKQIISNMIPGTISGTPDYAPSYDFTVSPSTPSTTQPIYYMVKVGTTVTLRVSNIQHMATIQFQVPPLDWGKGSIMTQPMTVTGDSIEYQYQVPPDVAGKRSQFAVYPLSPSGKPRPGTIDVVAVN